VLHGGMLGRCWCMLVDAGGWVLWTELLRSGLPNPHYLTLLDASHHLIIPCRLRILSCTVLLKPLDPYSASAFSFAFRTNSATRPRKAYCTLHTSVLTYIRLGDRPHVCTRGNTPRSLGVACSLCVQISMSRNWRVRRNRDSRMKPRIGYYSPSRSLPLSANTLLFGEKLQE
jgi:hypothetical protein